MQQPDGRVAGKEFRQQPGERILRQGHRAAQSHDAARLGPGKFHRRHGGLGFAEHGRGVAIDLMADIGHHEAAGGAIDQPDVQPRLQLAHMSRQP